MLDSHRKMLWYGFVGVFLVFLIAFSFFVGRASVQSTVPETIGCASSTLDGSGLTYGTDYTWKYHNSADFTYTSGSFPNGTLWSEIKVWCAS